MKERKEQGSVQLFVVGLGVALLLLGGIAFDLWRLLGDRRELAALADAAAIAAASGLDADVFRETGVVELDADLVERQVLAILEQQPPSAVDGLSAPRVTFDTLGCDVAVTFDRVFDFALLDFGRAPEIVLSATGCATPSRG